MAKRCLMLLQQLLLLLLCSFVPSGAFLLAPRVGARALGVAREHAHLTGRSDREGPGRRWTPLPCTPGEHGDEEPAPLAYEDLEAGDVVEVIAKDITFWHPVPYRKTGVNPFGWQGIFVKHKINWNDSVTTANRPVMVQVFDPAKCICHFELDELKLVRKGDDETRAKVPKRKV